MSAWEIGASISWGEACDLVDVALMDTSTELCASVSGWRYPAPMPDLVLMSVAVGSKGESVMPWAQESERPTEAEVAQAHSELMAEIKFAS